SYIEAKRQLSRLGGNGCLLLKPLERRTIATANARFAPAQNRVWDGWMAMPQGTPGDSLVVCSSRDSISHSGTESSVLHERGGWLGWLPRPGLRQPHLQNPLDEPPTSWRTGKYPSSMEMEGGHSGRALQEDSGW
ncbi:hypothetical protein CLAIMM_01112 isoform 1, partial [Cladophialophora immunda]